MSQKRKIMRNIAQIQLRQDGYRQINKSFKMKGSPSTSMFQFNWRKAVEKATGVKLPKPQQKRKKRRKAT